jgi:hypothetical protein
VIAGRVVVVVDTRGVHVGTPVVVIGMVLAKQDDVIGYVVEGFEDDVVVAKQEQALLSVDAMASNSVRKGGSLIADVGSDL